MLLRRFGADHVPDAARVLRLAGSLHASAGVQVRTIWPTTTHPVAYDFGDLCDETLEFTQDQLREMREQRAQRPAHGRIKVARKHGVAFDTQEWSHGVFCDIHGLARSRYPDGLPEGRRDEWLFIAACHIAHCVPPSTLLGEIAGLCRDLVGNSGWLEREFLRKYAANAFILPITGWLSAHLGRRNYFLASIAVFTLSSLMCGLAGSLSQLILFRAIQGLAGGGLQPGSQGILLDAFPREKQGVAMTLFAFAVLIAPIVGPTLGGWITDTYNWRWCFLINVPIGIAAFALCYFLLQDPDYLVAERTELRKEPFHFDAVGLLLLAIVIISWEVMLSKGQEWDWLGDPFWRVQTLVTSLVVGLVALIFWELRHRNPVVNFRALGERNFAACCIIIFCAYLALFAGTKSLLGLLQALFGYDALTTGLVMSPAGFFAVLAMPIVGRLIGLKVDARWLIAAGLLLMSAGNYWMSQLNLGISPGEVVWPRVVLVLGLSVCFAPANVAAYLYTPLALRGAAIGLLSLLRNEGGSVGVSLSQTFEERRDQFHALRLGESLDPFNPAVASFLAQAQARFLQQTGDPAAAQRMAWQALANLREQQSDSLAYFDTFWMAAALTFAVAFAVLLMKRSVAEKGAHVGSEG